MRHILNIVTAEAVCRISCNKTLLLTLYSQYFSFLLTDYPGLYLWTYFRNFDKVTKCQTTKERHSKPKGKSLSWISWSDMSIQSMTQPENTVYAVCRQIPQVFKIYVACHKELRHIKTPFVWYKKSKHCTFLTGLHV